VLETLDQRFVRTAVSNGFRGTTVLTRHVLRNSAIPLATVIAAQATLLLGGAVIVEQVFALPGMGSFVLTAIRQGDHPVVLGFVAAMAVTVALVQLVLDLSYAWIDPRVRVS
jgi:peptide/nickel transport system permease protein